MKMRRRNFLLSSAAAIAAAREAYAQTVPMHLLTDLGGARNSVVLTSTDSDTLYVIRPSSFGSALSTKMQRNLGDVAITNGSIGPPWPEFRKTGHYELLSTASDPTSPLFTYGADIGAFDYAMQESSTGLLGGSFHGAGPSGALNSEVWTVNGVVVNPLSGPFRGNSIKLTRQVLVWYASGKTNLVDYTLTFNADGTETETVSMTSTAAFAGTQYMTMEIAATAFVQAYANSTWTDISNQQDHPLGTTGDVTLRNPTTGHTIRTVTTAPQVSGYSDTFVRVDANRAKNYFHKASTAGAALGTVSCSRTTTLSKDSLAVYVEDFNGAALPGAWTITHPGGGSNVPVVSGGQCTWTRTASGTDDDRMSRAIPFTHVVGAQYRITTVVFSVTGASPSGGMFFGIGTASGSTSSMTVAQAGINTFSFPFTYVATQPTHYVLFREVGGTAGQTCAIDKIVIEKV